MTPETIHDWMIRLCNDVHEQTPELLSEENRAKAVKIIDRMKRVRSEEVKRLNELVDENALLREALQAATDRAARLEGKLMTKRYKAGKAGRTA